MNFAQRILLDLVEAHLPKPEIAPTTVTDTSEETKPTQNTKLTKKSEDTLWTKPTRNTDIGIKDHEGVGNGPH